LAPRRGIDPGAAKRTWRALYRGDWYRWVFAESHFGVGYRPVAALSYTLNYLIGGLNPAVYRATDLGLHLLAGLLVYSVFRRWVHDSPWWGAMVAAGVFLAHPAVENVVPFIARRSYTLATVLVLAGLRVVCPTSPGGGRRLWPGILMLWLAGYTVLYALAGVWSLRQVYPMLVALSLLVGSVLVDAIQTYRTRPWALAGHLAPQALLVAVVLAGSPLVRGPHPQRARLFESQHRRQVELLASLDGVTGPAYVRLVQPYDPFVGADKVMRVHTTLLPFRAQAPALWVRARLHDRAVFILDFVFLEQDSLSGTDPPRLTWSDERPGVLLGPGQLHYVYESGKFRRRHVGRPTLVRLDEPRLPSNAYCYVWMGAGPDAGLTLLRQPGSVRPRSELPD